jgi:hypothetical protein
MQVDTQKFPSDQALGSQPALFPQAEIEQTVTNWFAVPPYVLTEFPDVVGID